MERFIVFLFLLKVVVLLYFLLYCLVPVLCNVVGFVDSEQVDKAFFEVFKLMPEIEKHMRHGGRKGFKNRYRIFIDV